MTDSLRLPVFDIETTLLGGQSFRWKKEVTNGVTSFLGIIQDQIIQVRWEGATITALRLSAPGNSTTDLAEYFDLQRDYLSVTRNLCRDPELSRFLAPVFSPARQPRVLRQPWFETLISFIVSANNNIPRIRKTVDVISRSFGKKVRAGIVSGFAFPPPEALSAASLETLRGECNAGYRDSYILETSKIVTNRIAFWNAHHQRTTGELRAALLELPGVGPKVAECVLLFGFHRWEAFPVDTWVRKAVHEAFPGTERYCDRDVMTFARERFGPLAGFAQQLLFEAARKRASLGSQPGGQPFQAGL